MGKKAKPKTRVEEWEEIVKQAALRLREKQKALAATLGDRAFFGETMDENEEFMEYGRVRNNLDEWMKIMSTDLRVKPGGRALLPTALVERTIKYETRLREGTL